MGEYPKKVSTRKAYRKSALEENKNPAALILWLCQKGFTLYMQSKNQGITVHKYNNSASITRLNMYKRNTISTCQRSNPESDLESRGI